MKMITFNHANTLKNIGQCGGAVIKPSGIGKRSALRLALNLLQRNEKEIHMSLQMQ